MILALLPGLIFLTLVLIAVVSAIRGVWISAFVSRRYATPHCPGCRYEIDQSNPIALCPECGRDLRVAGVLTPELVLRLKGSVGNIWGGIGLVTVIACLIAGFVGVAIAGEFDTPGGEMAGFLLGLVIPVPIGVAIAIALHGRRNRLLGMSSRSAAMPAPPRMPTAVDQESPSGASSSSSA